MSEPKKRRSPLDGAAAKGAAAKAEGKPRDACPYVDKRQASGKVSFSRSFRNAWFHGYDGTYRP